MGHRILLREGEGKRGEERERIEGGKKVERREEMGGNGREREGKGGEGTGEEGRGGEW